MAISNEPGLTSISGRKDTPTEAKENPKLMLKVSVAGRQAFVAEAVEMLHGLSGYMASAASLGFGSRFAYAEAASRGYAYAWLAQP
jgi:hypothetical protein